MKWHFITIEESIARMKAWSRWFAWHPVRLEDGRMAWLEVVERQAFFHYDISWKYREAA
jgi:hypothetical protein